MLPIKERLAVNPVNSTITIPHWGVTLRTLYGAAISAWPERKPGETREFTVVHKDKPIAVLSVQEHPTI